MYRCQLCCKTVPSNTPATKITIETRAVGYPERLKVNACRKRFLVHGEPRIKAVRTNDSGGRGYECQREITVCPECAAARQANGHRLMNELQI